MIEWMTRRAEDKLEHLQFLRTLRRQGASVRVNLHEGVRAMNLFVCESIAYCIVAYY